MDHQLLPIREDPSRICGPRATAQCRLRYSRLLVFLSSHCTDFWWLHLPVHLLEVEFLGSLDPQRRLLPRHDYSSARDLSTEVAPRQDSENV